MTYRARRSGPWGQGLRAPRRREFRSRASSCHEHRPRISLPWQPCRTPEGLIALLRCAAARLFLRSQSRGFSTRARRSGRIRRPFLRLQLPPAPPLGRFPSDYVLDAIKLNFAPSPLADQLPVADFDVDRDELAALIATSRADGNDLPFLGFFLRGIRDDDAATRLLFSFDPLDDDAIVKWTEFHGLPPRR